MQRSRLFFIYFILLGGEGCCSRGGFIFYFILFFYFFSFSFLFDLDYLIACYSLLEVNFFFFLLRTIIRLLILSSHTLEYNPLTYHWSFVCSSVN